MPIPLVIGAAIAAAGGVGAYFGYKSRDAEVKALKDEIRFLQSEVVRLQKLVAEQQEQFEVLQNKYMSLHKLKFLEKKAVSDKIKKIVVQGIFEREKCRLLLKGGDSLTHDENRFLNISRQDERDDEDKEFCLNYLYSKYENEINDNAYPASGIEYYVSQYESVSSQAHARLKRLEEN